jgi:phage portal protein BeeE
MVVWRALTQWVTRLFVAPSLLFASAGDAASPTYDVASSMSALSQFPWIYTCISAIASDMAGLPKVAVEKTPPGNRKARRKRELVDDPALDRLENPNAGMDGNLFEQQLWVDYLASGDAYIWRPSGIAIYRLHPKRVRICPGPLGMAAAYQWTDEQDKVHTLDPAEVIHIRGPSWSDDASSLYGQSRIACIHDDLVIELQSRKTAGIHAAKARPDILFSVKGLTGMGDAGTAAIRRKWEEAIAAKHGAFVMGGEVTATQLGWSPDAFPFLERSVVLRDVILALFGVPPTRAGLPSANYGGSRQEMRVYWEANIGRGKPFERAWTLLARPGVRIEYDYTAVEALQVSYTERLMRVSTWRGLGASSRAAAEYEGFDEAPVPDLEPDADEFHSPRPIDRPAEEPQDDRDDKSLGARVAAALELHLRTAAGIYSELSDQDVDRRLIVRLHSELLFTALDQAGLDPADARWWAEELCAITDEAHGMGLPDTFDPARAARFAERICAAREAA